MRICGHLILALIVVFALAKTATAAVCDSNPCKYVRAGASGNGSDWTNAYGALPSRLTRGTVYLIADGTYPAYDFNTPNDSSKLITILKATAEEHGTSDGWLAAYGDGQAVWPSLTFSTSDYVWDGRTGGGPGQWTSGFGFKITQTNDHGISLVGVANVTLRHFEIIGNLTDGAIGVRVAPRGTNITVSYYYMDKIGNCPFFLAPVTNFVAEYGYVGRFFGTPENHSEIASIWAGVKGTTTFRYNIFTHVESTGGLMWDNHEDHSASFQVYGNVFYRAPTNTAWSNSANGVIGGWKGAHAEDCYNMRIYNNTFVNISGLVFTDFALRSGDNEVFNNLFVNSTSPSYADIQSHDYNHYIGAGGTHGEANGTSATANLNDVFVDISKLDFRLKVATPPGKNVTLAFGKDPYGRSRGADGVLDRGAYEFGGSITDPPAKNPTLTAPTNLRVISIQKIPGN
jgi:hypothetical protein